jgi:hypothetical protein
MTKENSVIYLFKFEVADYVTAEQGNRLNVFQTIDYTGSLGDIFTFYSNADVGFTY